MSRFFAGREVIPPIEGAVDPAGQEIVRKQSEKRTPCSGGYDNRAVCWLEVRCMGVMSAH